MSIRILYFARLREEMGSSGEVFDFRRSTTSRACARN